MPCREVPFMNGRIRNLVFGYGSATLVQGMVGFVAVPFMLAVLGPQAFAQWAMLEPLVAVLAGFALAGAHYGHLHSITSRLVTPAAALRQILRYGWMPALIVPVAGGAAAAWFLGLGSASAVALLCVVYVAIEAAILLLQFQARAMSDALAFASTVWLRSGGIALGLFIFRLFDFELSLVQYLIFMILLDITVFSVACLRHLNTLRAAFSKCQAKPEDYIMAVRYGLPIMLAAGLAMLVNNGDRYIVHALLAADKLPAYIVMAKLAGAMSFAMAPINLWWPVARHQHVQDLDGGARFFANIIPLLLGYYILAAAVLWVAGGILVQWYAPNIHGFDGATFLLLLSGGVVIGMTTPVNIGALSPGKTHWLIVSVGFSAMVGLAASIFLIPILGCVGAALATLCAQIINLVLIIFVSRKIQKITIYNNKIAIIGLLGVLLAVALWISQDALILQLLIVTVFFILMIIFLTKNMVAVRVDK